MEKKIFDTEFVYFIWDDKLKDKKGFVSDNIGRLRHYVETHDVSMFCSVEEAQKDAESYPFSRIDDEAPFRFFYYDPLYDVKLAWKQGKRIQCRAPSGIWLDAATPNWDNKALEFRIKPDEPVYRPFKDIQELKSTFLRLLHFTAIYVNTEPIIWVRSKSSVTSTFMITHFNGSMGTVHLFSSMSVSLETLFNDYTFLDGTPCGVKED